MQMNVLLRLLMLRRCIVRLLLTQLQVTNIDKASSLDEVVATNVVPNGDKIETTNVEATTATASMKQYVHTGRELPRGPNEQSVLTKYDDHLTYQLW